MALTLCTMCERHVRETEARCPFCDAPVHAGLVREVRQAPLTRAMAFAAVALIGCREEKTPLERPGPYVAASTEPSATVPAVPVVADASVPETAAVATEDAGTHDAPVDAATPVVKVAKPPPPPNLAKPYGAPPADGLFV
ncbi:MAG: hypothetical protein ACXWUG_17160 [Polyangiales bacterium]